jgi:hypothetical protein
MLRTLTALAVLAAAQVAIPTTASAELLIAPTRIVLGPTERSTELVVVNKGGEEAAFRISLENRRMNLDGSMEEVSEGAETIEGENFAKDFIRFSPRRIVLDAGERQTVRVSARLEADMEPGEYRSHLRLQGAPLSAGRTLQSATSTEGGDLSIQLIAIRSITIPVIMRVGQLDAEVQIESVDIRDTDAEDETLLVARLTRTGNRSTYGDIKIFSPDQPEPIYFARGIALYTPNKERDLVLPIPTELTNSLSGKDIRIEYVSSDPQAPGVIADLTTRLP